tara:strand:+ start:1340 stop:1573 length:234 start_codon:yes stop_codon:yes gene_type:complete
LPCSIGIKHPDPKPKKKNIITESNESKYFSITNMLNTAPTKENKIKRGITYNTDFIISTTPRVIPLRDEVIKRDTKN